MVGEKYIRLYDPVHSERLYALGSSMLNNTSSVSTPIVCKWETMIGLLSFLIRLMWKIPITSDFLAFAMFLIWRLFFGPVICCTCPHVIGTTFVHCHPVSLSIFGGHKNVNKSKVRRTSRNQTESCRCFGFNLTWSWYPLVEAVAHTSDHFIGQWLKKSKSSVE